MCRISLIPLYLSESALRVCPACWSKRKIFIWIPCSFNSCASADPEGGGGGPGVRNPPPPLRFVRGGVFCRGLMGGRGGQTVVLTLLLSIFFGSLRSPVLYTYYKLNVQYGTVILSLYSPYPNNDNNPTFNPLLLGIFILFLSRITRFYTI